MVSLWQICEADRMSADKGDNDIPEAFVISSDDPKRMIADIREVTIEDVRLGCWCSEGQQNRRDHWTAAAT
jgi:hypothetical protein